MKLLSYFFLKVYENDYFQKKGENKTYKFYLHSY